jgi:copper chaperone NosL
MKPRRTPLLALVCLVPLPLGGCGGAEDAGPPTVRYGHDLCAECNMILSDERFAASTVVQGPRGRTALLFDDYNCQANHAAKHPDLVVLERWAHDHATRAWIPAEHAFFVHSEQIRSPMASRLAAFAEASDAQAAAAELDGRVLGFESVASALEAGAPGAAP